MAELLDAYQRTHETMGTLAKNVGKNNEVLQNATTQLGTYASTIDEHHNQIEAIMAAQESQQSSISSLHQSTAMLTETASVQSARIDLLVARVNELEKQCDFLLNQMQKTHKQIFWYLIAVIIVNVGGLIAFHMVTP